MNHATRPEHIRWLLANKHDLGCLTGSDFKALDAIAPLLVLYSYTGHRLVLRACGLAAAEMQESTRPLAKELIAFVLDWDDRDRLWPQIEIGISEGLSLKPQPAFPLTLSSEMVTAIKAKKR